jgi:hypothetical protein
LPWSSDRTCRKYFNVTMTSASSLVVPMVMWGPRAPTHCISALYLLRDQRTLVTGAADGQVSSTLLKNRLNIQPLFLVKL